jgi:hypothetical protein
MSPTTRPASTKDKVNLGVPLLARQGISMKIRDPSEKGTTLVVLQPGENHAASAAEAGRAK